MQAQVENGDSSKARFIDRPVDNQPLFWVVLGPLGLLMTIALLSIKSPGNFLYLPTAALLGMALTWALRLKGFLLALSALIAVSFTQLLIPTNSEDFLWFLGSILTLALSFFITLLTLEEAESGVKSTAESWRDQARTYFETIVTASAESTKRDEVIKANLQKIEQLNSVCLQKEAEYQCLEKVHELGRVELLSMISKQEVMEREQAEISKQLKDSELAHSEVKEQYQDCKKNAERLRVDFQQSQHLNKEKSEHIDTLSREKDLLESMLNRLQGELELKQQELADQPNKFAKFAKENEESLQAEQTKYQAAQQELNQTYVKTAELESKVAELDYRYEQEKETLSKLIQEKSTKLEVLEAATLDEAKKLAALTEALPEDFVPTESEYRRLYGQHKQLRDQFTEKSNWLDQTRKDLFIANEQAALLEKEMAEIELREPLINLPLSKAFEELSQQYEEALNEIAKLEALITRCQA